MIIALGESVLSIVLAVSNTLTPLSACTGALALTVTAGLAWSMFMFGVDAMRDGLEHLVQCGDSRGIVQTFAFLPYLLVAGIMMLAGALSISIVTPTAILPASAGVSLGVGVALFYTSNALIGVRYGARASRVLAWAVPAILLPLAVLPIALVLPAAWATAAMAVALVVVVSISERLARRVSAIKNR